jgi:hypothetical protein
MEFQSECGVGDDISVSNALVDMYCKCATQSESDHFSVSVYQLQGCHLLEYHNCRSFAKWNT